MSGRGPLAGSGVTTWARSGRIYRDSPKGPEALRSPAMSLKKRRLTRRQSLPLLVAVSRQTGS
jgi:hypothetical protein